MTFLVILAIAILVTAAVAAVLFTAANAARSCDNRVYFMREGEQASRTIYDSIDLRTPGSVTGDGRVNYHVTIIEDGSSSEKMMDLVPGHESAQFEHWSNGLYRYNVIGVNQVSFSIIVEKSLKA